LTITTQSRRRKQHKDVLHLHASLHMRVGAVRPGLLRLPHHPLAVHAHREPGGLHRVARHVALRVVLRRRAEEGQEEDDQDAQEMGQEDQEEGQEVAEELPQEHQSRLIYVGRPSIVDSDAASAKTKSEDVHYLFIHKQYIICSRENNFPLIF
jgi:hypothetical protein